MLWWAKRSWPRITLLSRQSRPLDLRWVNKTRKQKIFYVYKTEKFYYCSLPNFIIFFLIVIFSDNIFQKVCRKKSVFDRRLLPSDETSWSVMSDRREVVLFLILIIFYSDIIRTLNFGFFVTICLAAFTSALIQKLRNWNQRFLQFFQLSTYKWWWILTLWNYKSSFFANCYLFRDN